MARISPAGHETDHRLSDVRLDISRRRLLGVAADLANHDDGVRVRIRVEQLQRVQERGPDDRVAADPDAGGLADPELGQLPYGFVGQRARARYHAHMALS